MPTPNFSRLVQTSFPFEFLPSLCSFPQFSSPILSCKPSYPIQLRVPLFIQSHSNQLELSCVFLEEFPLQSCQNVSIFLELALSFQNFRASYQPQLWLQMHTDLFLSTKHPPPPPAVLHQRLLKPALLMQASPCFWLGLNIWSFLIPPHDIMSLFHIQKSNHTQTGSPLAKAKETFEELIGQFLQKGVLDCLPTN